MQRLEERLVRSIASSSPSAFAFEVLLEAPEPLVGVAQLRVGVADLHPIDEELETLGEAAGAVAP